jgi:hypothetical protein
MSWTRDYPQIKIAARMRYWISFIDDLDPEARRLLDVCIVDSETRQAALAAARAVCQRKGRARVVPIPEHIAVDPADLGRRLPRERVDALSQHIERQLAAQRRHGQER